MSVKSAKTRRTSSSTPSILKKTSSLKRRLNEIIQTPTKVRFQLPHCKKIQTILENFVKSNDPKEYLSLICLIRDAELLDTDLSSVLEEATNCISLLNRNLRLFVEVLLSVAWIQRDVVVVKEYQSFILNLVIAHNYHAKFAVDSLVGLFLPRVLSKESSVGSQMKFDEAKYIPVHTLINALLNDVPMCKDLLLKSITRQYPYYNKPVHFQEHYLHNLLSIVKYKPSFRPDVLHLIFSKLVIMDVNAPKEVIENEKIDQQEIFLMDEDIKSVQSGFTLVDRNALGSALDVCMDITLDYVLEECNNDVGELDWEKTKTLYQDLVTVFDKVILPTYGTHHVQFVMFKLCGLKSTLCEAFLNHLWKKVCNPNVAIVLRQAAATYIASLIARGLFIPLSLLKGTLQQMAQWIHAYEAAQDSVECVISDVRVHSVFYSVCQALFYLIAFRHKDLVTSKKNIVFLQSLQLGKIVTSRLNPLRVCQPAVVQNFAAVTRQYQVAYCYTIIDHNTRNTMHTIHQDEKGSRVISDNILSDFYPFDPYVLIRSSEKIKHLYRNYTEDSLESNMEVDNIKENQEVDDFLENVHDVSSKFSYGSSPGFKFKI